jgi:hypothetical protein
MTETNLHDTMDAKVWAAEFVKTFLNNPCIAADEGTMIGWFANAIMAGFDEANRRTETRLRAAERDAARYRWLRSSSQGMGSLSLHHVIVNDYSPPYYELKHGEELDVAIDAALEEILRGQEAALVKVDLHIANLDEIEQRRRG